MELMPHQEEAIGELDNGKILYGGVGSGKSLTAIAYYAQKESPRDIYVITTAKKRDSNDWYDEAVKFGIGNRSDMTNHGVIFVDSWNNIGKYTDVQDAFFIFDEQRLVGHGAWVKAFIKIAKQNRWILLSGTPGDVWLDYAPVFIANGFYKNITDFKMKHVLYEPFTRFPKVKGYLNERKLELLRNHILVEMPFLKHTERVLNWLEVGFDRDLVGRVYKDRWNIFEDRPVKDASEMFRATRRVVNTDSSRLEMLRELMKVHPRLIVFYNFNYELELLRTVSGRAIFEYNGHRKDPTPSDGEWLYLVQYQAGAEGWNCVATDAMVLYSLNYSYKLFEQAQGRIDRLNTKFSRLYYYIFVTNSVTDLAIRESLGKKESFNERKYLYERFDPEEFIFEGWGDLG